MVGGAISHGPKIKGELGDMGYFAGYDITYSVKAFECSLVSDCEITRMVERNCNILYTYAGRLFRSWRQRRFRCRTRLSMQLQ